MVKSNDKKPKRERRGARPEPVNRTRNPMMGIDVSRRMYFQANPIQEDYKPYRPDIDVINKFYFDEQKHLQEVTDILNVLKQAKQGIGDDSVEHLENLLQRKSTLQATLGVINKLIIKDYGKSEQALESLIEAFNEDATVYRKLLASVKGRIDGHRFKQFMERYVQHAGLIHDIADYLKNEPGAQNFVNRLHNFHDSLLEQSQYRLGGKQRKGYSVIFTAELDDLSQSDVSEPSRSEDLDSDSSDSLNMGRNRSSSGN